MCMLPPRQSSTIRQLHLPPTCLPLQTQTSPQRRDNSPNRRDTSPQRRGVQTSAAAVAEPPTAGANGSGLNGSMGAFNAMHGKKAAADLPEPADLLTATGEKQPRSLKKLRSVVADLKARQAELQEQMGSAAQVRRWAGRRRCAMLEP